MMLTPHITGTVPIRASAVQFVQAFQQRVAAGLLIGRPHPRSNYRVINAGASGLDVCAADWSTAISVGLNDIELRLPAAVSVNYHVRYWRWASCLDSAVGQHENREIVSTASRREP
jgi:hypothetical protein